MFKPQTDSLDIAQSSHDNDLANLSRIQLNSPPGFMTFSLVAWFKRSALEHESLSKTSLWCLHQSSHQTVWKNKKSILLPECWTVPVMHWLFFCLLCSTTCYCISILTQDKRQLTHSHPQQSSSLKWKCILYQTLQGLFTLTSAGPAVCNNVPVISISLCLFASSVHVLMMQRPKAKPAGKYYLAALSYGD